jgi:crotonobetainyl-CoA:carnitine CoA-transferase CaiB-like acyl-CoA transferase
MPPLSGLLVLDFSTLLPGPLATLMLAEAGAEVVKVERPGTGDEIRSYAPRFGADSVNFALLNRGKKSIVLDLKDKADRARLDPLLARADVLVEQFRPGVMDRLGLGYATLAAQHPRLIYCSITGYGQTGPKAPVAGHDLNYVADAGLLSLAHGDPERPVVPPALVADIGGGAYPAVINILLALSARERSGKGCHLDVAMTENVLPFAYWALGVGAVTGQYPGNAAGTTTGGSPRYRLYPTADGRIVAAAPLEQRFWDVFCALIELDPALRDDRRDRAATCAAVAAIIASKPADHWRAVFAGQDCCCTVMATMAEAIADPHFEARGIFARRIAGEAGASMPALPLPLAPSFRTLEESAPAPTLGADNATLLGD